MTPDERIDIFAAGLKDETNDKIDDAADTVKDILNDDNDDNNYYANDE